VVGPLFELVQVAELPSTCSAARRTCFTPQNEPRASGSAPHPWKRRTRRASAGPAGVAGAQGWRLGGVCRG